MAHSEATTGVSVATRWREAAVLAALSVLTLGVYLPYSLTAGWFYDDWSLYSQARDAGGSWLHRVDVCSSTVAAGRTFACAYHVTEYEVFGSHRVLYHLAVIGFLILIAACTYAILVRCRLPWPWAALIAGLVILSPASDSTRLWSVAAIGLFVIALTMGATLIALHALRRPRGRLTLALDVTAAVLSMIAMITYEIAVPLVALNGSVYVAALRTRRALWRGLIDVGLVGVFLVHRLAISPAAAASGITVKRHLGAEITRAGVLLKGAWATWHATYLPGTLGLLAIVAVVAAAITLAVIEPEARRRLAPWGCLLIAAVVTAAICALTFLPANDLYVPALDGTFNRLNLPGTLAYAAAFAALLGLGYELVRRLVPLQWIAPAAVVAAVLVIGVHQLDISWYHKRAWEDSSREQRAALAGYRRALASLPRTSRIVGFDTPMFEAGFVPVFAATWDLRGAIDYTTPVDPPVAAPFAPTMSCGPTGLVLDGTPLTPYTLPGSRLYGVSPRRVSAVLIDSQVSCLRLEQQWGPVPLFGVTD